jgi:DNA-binding winged helix-turn-helix (wHTH) protein
MTAAIYVFGEFELDLGLYELRARGEVARIEPKVFDVLADLVRHRDRVVTKDELLERLWPGETVSDSVLPRCVAAVRKAIGHGAIQTVHGRGYRFVAPLSAGPPAVPTAGPGERTPPAGIFVGREGVMGELRAALDDALAGRGRVALLVGEPGIGKTRTAEELAAEARARGAVVLTGRCHEGEGAPAFWPWVQILRAHVVGRESRRLAADLGSGAADVAQLVPEVQAAVPGVPPLVASAAEQARFRLFESVTGYLERVSRREPLVLVLDDLHWADKPSLLLLQFLAREMRVMRLLVVGTYRDVELGRQHPLAAVLGELAREAPYRRIALRGLTADEVRRFIEAAAGAPPEPALAAAVYDMTEGNPFFIGEVVRLLAAEGAPAAGSDVTLAGRLPEGVREAIGRRLSVLSEECNRVLSEASVVGREFDLGVLERVGDVGAERLLEILDEAVAARLLAAVPGRPGSYRFSHGLVRETLYEELSLPLRIRLHRRVGAVLEELHGADPAPHLAELAHHFFQGAPGGDAEKAYAYALRAAERALELLAYEESARHCERALQALDLAAPADAVRRCEVLLRLGEARSRAGERDDARRAFQTAADAARRLGRADLLAHAALGFGGRAEFGAPRDDALLALLDDATRALGEAHPDLRARLLGRLVGTAPHSESMETRDALSREAVALARRVGEPLTLAEALNARHWALLGPDHVAERRTIAAELQGIARRTGDRGWAFMAHNHEYDALLELGEIAAADRELDALAALAEELRQPIERWFVAWFRAGRALADGRFDEAERLIAQGRALGRRAQHPVAEASFGGQMLWLRGERGYRRERERFDDFMESFAFIRRTLPSARRILQAGVASVYVGFEREREARAELDALAAERFADFPRDEHWITTLCILSDVAAFVGDRERAATLYDLLLPFADRNAVHSLIRTSRGAVSYYLGRLAGARQRFAEAQRHFEAALAMNARMGARPLVARVQCDYAGMLLDRGRSQDRRQARELLAACGALARDLGMEWLQERVAELLVRAERAGASRARRRG